jgi:DNA-binding response OmpR family regulator
MLTARDDVVDRVVRLEVGADDYLTKPFSMRELVARVRALLRRSELIQQMLMADRDEPLTTISRGPLLLDPAAHLVSLDGEPVELSRTEFNLLHLLLRNPGRTFGRAYLLDTVRG